MSLSLATTSTATNTFHPATRTTSTKPQLPPPPKTPASRSLRRPSASASTPNLNTAYNYSAASAQVRFTPSALSRKTSLATLTPSTLASIPDASDTYPLDSAPSDYLRNMAPATPGRVAAESLAVGEIVEVPGAMQGTVRFVGPVQGKKGVFAGVELHQEFAAKGKNSGDVDGVSYFTTAVPGAGIFLPVAKAVKRDSPGRSSMGSFPATPTTGAFGGLKAGTQNSTNFTPPTPSLPKFSASVGPGVRAPSPQGKRPRTSLPRPDSPVRRSNIGAGPRPSIASPPKAPARYGSPTNRFAQSVRGTAGDPSKRPSRLEHKPSFGPRSASALGSAAGIDDDATPTGTKGAQANGSIGSSSSFNNKMRPPSRANGSNDEEIGRLRAQLEERDRQVKDQAATLADMEHSLVELQSLIEASDLPKPERSDLDDKDSTQLRHMLREKNEKIAMLTAEFDAHRADFRSTIDTLEMASTETERVYEKRIEELTADVRELESRNLDVDSVASQLKQLEELVQELEEGLEDARRGEAEARGEVEFLRGEVERTRAELRREREKPGTSPTGGARSDNTATSKELEQKEDEIRGLKAIIHSLSRDSVPGADVKTPTRRISSFISNEAVDNKIARDNLERQVAELQSILDKRSSREAELEMEVESLRNHRDSLNRNSVPPQRSSLRDSRDTVVLARGQEAHSPEAPHKRGGGKLEINHESDSYSTATENSTLWCEICETSGHDILTCTNMFGPDGDKPKADTNAYHGSSGAGLRPLNPAHDNAHPAPLSPAKSKARAVSPAVKILPNPMESGPVAGKESGIMDPEKWCAVCERDGHDSVDCPFEDAF